MRWIDRVRGDKDFTVDVLLALAAIVAGLGFVVWLHVNLLSLAYGGGG